jgi:LysM repeat protein
MTEFTKEDQTKMLQMYKTSEIKVIADELKKTEAEVIYNIGLLIDNNIKNGKTYEAIGNKLHKDVNDIIKMHNNFTLSGNREIKLHSTESKLESRSESENKHRKKSKKEIDNLINNIKDENDVLEILIKNKRLKEDLKTMKFDDNIKDILSYFKY